MAASEPQRFGKYQILERIAAGGMAEIFKARLDGIGGFHRTFAIKRILPNLTANPEFVDMLVDEAKIAGLLSHANIVQILDLGNIDNQFYIAMEYVNGRDLGQILTRCADKGITLPVPHAAYVLVEMLKGLEYAHNRQVMRGGRPVPLNIVHRDISPANVLVSFQGEVKLTDFGIAKASVKALETAAGVVKGRYDYMSPEQASGGDVDQRSDLFSAGVMLYQLLTGRHPFRQPTELATIEAIRKGVFEPPSYVNPDVPYPLDLVVEQALKVSPAERFATATAFKDALDRFFHDSGFIFSASTLAAFLKGLFPEAEPRPVAPAPLRAVPPAEPVREEAPVEDEKRRPTPRATLVPPLPGADSTVADAAALLRNGAVGAQTGTFGPIAGLADESTLIRPMPSEVGAWSEAETVIRPDPTKTARGMEIPPGGKGAAAARPAEARPAERPPEPRPARPESIAPAADRPRPSEAPRARVVYRTPTTIHAIYLAVASFCLVSGGIVGFIFGMARGSAFAASDPPVVKLDPVLELQFPTGTQVAVDGKPVTAPSPAHMTLTAGRPAVISVRGADLPATETQVTLDYNQMRVLTFTSVNGGAVSSSSPQKKEP